MKNLLVATMFLSVGTSIFAQTLNPSPEEVVTKNALGQTVIASKPSGFWITPPLSEWKDADPNEMKNPKEIRNDFEREAYLDGLVDNTPGTIWFRISPRPFWCSWPQSLCPSREHRVPRIQQNGKSLEHE